MSWKDKLPQVRGRVLRDEPLAPFTWLRVGGPADAIFMPADEADLAAFLSGLDPGVPVIATGVGSNMLVRDGGVDGVVIRLGKPFAGVERTGDTRLTAGAAVLDAQLAKAAAAEGLAGLEFYAGIPGTVGGAVAMNAGCYGAETREVCVRAHGLDRRGEPVSYDKPGEFVYRHGWGSEEGVVVTRAEFEGRPDDPTAITARMAEITERREKTQPIREKTGGSTFKNPPGHSSWKLVDEAGWRGRPYGGAMFSPLHSNFLINGGEATAADLEGLGEAVRADVKAKFGVELEWEIKRIGRPG
ncbi:UDP-N-acetylmuramate dehydrogenase [Phenylobacterium sp.]|jgi:UDP-N-acetylmuramate dehydrogenase|uniref:UDP-N-acetylmuramate dehydrogenase n=1 Tax=Phenylobacterium sp. TaxID=1871053 RepID=UPI002F956FE7